MKLQITKVSDGGVVYNIPPGDALTVTIPKEVVDQIRKEAVQEVVDLLKAVDDHATERADAKEIWLHVDGYMSFGDTPLLGLQGVIDKLEERFLK